MYLAVEGESALSNGWGVKAEFRVYPDKNLSGSVWPINVEVEDMSVTAGEDKYIHLAFASSEAEDLARKILALIEQEALNASVTE